VSGAVTFYEWTATQSTYIIQACVDITNLSIFLAAFAAQGGTIPDAAMTALSIATYILSFVHFQTAVVATTSRDFTTAEAEAVAAFLLANPGKEEYAYLTECDVSITTCPDL
jgi:hypothetical protein